MPLMERNRSADDLESGHLRDLVTVPVRVPKPPTCTKLLCKALPLIFFCTAAFPVVIYIISSMSSLEVESVEIVDDMGHPLGAQPLGLTLTQGWLHRAVHLAEVDPGTGLLRLQDAEGEPLEVTVERVRPGEGYEEAALRAANLAKGSQGPVRISSDPVKVTYLGDYSKDVHLAEVWCVEVPSPELGGPSAGGDSWLSPAAAGQTQLPPVDLGQTQLPLAKSTQLVVQQMLARASSKANLTHFGCGSDVK